jgi:fumarate reductase subunit C
VNSMAPATFNRPKMYRRPMPLLWWLQNRAYFRFVVRELTSIFVGFFAVLTIWQARALAEGPDAYASFMDRLSTPGFAILNGVSLAFVLYHAITWFNLAPTAIVVRVGETRVPDWIIAGANYAACVALSAAVAWILLRG